MDLNIQGRTALVTAAGGGLGRAIAIALAREGVNVALGDLDQASLDASAKAVEEHNVRALPLIWDLGDLTGIDERVRNVEEKLGTVDILVNMTGGPPPTTAGGQDPALWLKHFQAMTLSVIALTDRILPSMRARKWGRIITSTSSGIIAPIANLGISNTLRMSLVGWSKTLAREVAADGITANILVPGRIATERVRVIDAARAKRENRPVEEVTRESQATIPVGRYGDPEEYGAAAAFLAAKQSGYITGSVIRVDGGLIASI